jgi:uncharacterized protein
MTLPTNARLEFVALFLLITASLSFAMDSNGSLGHASLLIPAVEKTDSGSRGSMASLEIFLRQGDGQVFVDTLPLTEIDTQAGARIAKQAVEETLNMNLDRYDIFFIIRSDAPTISGPSAGGAMATGLLSIMLNLTLDKNVIMTGVANPDGSLGRVGGIFEKAQTAYQNKAKFFLIPRGQQMVSLQTNETNIPSNTSSTIDLIDYSAKNWNMTIVEVSDIEQALEYMTGYGIERSSPNITKSKVLDDSMKVMAEDFIVYVEQRLSYVEKKLNTTQVPPDRKSLWMNLTIEHEKKIAEAKKALDDGEYYTATSFCFTTAIEIDNIDKLMDFFNANDREEFSKNLLLQTESRINGVSEESGLKKKQIDSPNDIDVILLSYERINEANSYIKEARKKFDAGSYEETIFFISYANERAGTVERWIRLTDSFSGNKFDFDFNRISSLARIRLMETISLINYADVLTLDTTTAESQANQARINYNNGSYEMALFNTVAIKSSLEAQMAMASTDFNDTVDVSQRLGRMETRALEGIKLCQDNGITPIMAINYYEYGTHFENTSAETAMLYLIYSRNFALIDKNVGEIVKGKDFSQDFKLFPLERRELPPYTTEVLMLTAFVAGSVTGIMISPGLRSERKQTRTKEEKKNTRRILRRQRKNTR